jgi:hypothetical protein
MGKRRLKAQRADSESQTRRGIELPRSAIQRSASDERSPYGQASCLSRIDRVGSALRAAPWLPQHKPESTPLTKSLGKWPRQLANVILISAEIDPAIATAVCVCTGIRHEPHAASRRELGAR